MERRTVREINKILLILGLIFAVACSMSGCNESDIPQSSTETDSGETATQPAAETEPALDISSAEAFLRTIKPGNVHNIWLYKKFTARDIASAFNCSAVKVINEEEANAKGFIRDETKGMEWWMEFTVIDDGIVIKEDVSVSSIFGEVTYPDGSISSYDKFVENGGTDRFVSLTALPESDVVELNVYKNGAILHAYVESRELKEVVRHSKDYEENIDGEALEKYGKYFIPLIEECTASMADWQDSDKIIGDYVITQFKKIWEGEPDKDGNSIILYEYRSAIELKDYKNFIGAGGMYMDSKLRVQGFNGGFGQLAVKLNGEKLIKAELIYNDEILYPEFEGDNMRERLEDRMAKD